MGDQQARESFGSILSWYYNNRHSLESVPDWVDNPESQNVVIGILRDSDPTDEQVEKAKEELRALIAMEETKDKLSEAEKSLMISAANPSRAKRLQNKKDK